MPCYIHNGRTSLYAVCGGFCETAGRHVVKVNVSRTFDQRERACIRWAVDNGPEFSESFRMVNKYSVLRMLLQEQ